MKVGYLINQYPKVSHSFVRREILSLEKQGVNVKRYSIRDSSDGLVDKRDLAEYEKTTTLLNLSVKEILKSTLMSFITKPIGFIKSFIFSLKIGLKSEAGLLKHVIYFIEGILLSKLILKDEVSHVHAHFGTNSTTVAMIACRFANIPFSFTVHGPEEFDKPAFIALPEKIKHAAFVVAISSFGRSQLYRLVPNELWSKIQVVHCGLESEFFTNSVEVDTNDLKQNNTVCIGRLCEQKAQALIIDALNIVKSKNIDFHLTLVGDGEMRADIEKKITQYNLNDNVTITGWMSSDQVREEILKAQFTLLPSFAEGLPVVIMESMSLKRPVLSTYIAGIPELIKNDENGWLVPAGDVVSLANQLEKIFSLPKEEVQAIGEKAYSAVTVRHNIDTEASKLIKLFNKSNQDMIQQKSTN